eukprot:TRINITY_DN45213_c0_g1_i1.p1 TRINITY_DN45213_c0_g1~~TRINITY_DN45213_c0_g1_i1.p1  ORF type:complete len:244 (-),score=46.63 TRINITY_DN45213_c0_g1_i1:180-911(-)
MCIRDRSSTALWAAALTSSAEAAEQPTLGASAACVDCAGPGSPETSLTLLGFGHLTQVLAIQQPSSWGLVPLAPYHKAGYHFARAVALYATGDRAQGELEAGLAVNASASDDTYRVIIAQEVVAAREWYMFNNTTGAINALENARAADDNNRYTEPPRWYYPIRHCLGYLYLKVDAQRALTVFHEALSVFPENARSLLGVSQALALLGQHAQSEGYAQRAVVAWRGADVPLSSSCPQLSYKER